MTMLEAALFDLDDTLLRNDMAQFIPRYFSLLSKFARPLFDAQDEFLQHLLAGTQAMIENRDRDRTNREIFWEQFEMRTGLDPGETEAFFDTFYREQFPQLKAVTAVRTVSRELVDFCVSSGLKVVIATNPLFPRRAVEERLAWAGLPVTDIDFDLVTTYENMHATKPHIAYYREILEAVGIAPAKAVMVGDDWENDIVPASQLGIDTFYIVDGDADVPDPDLLVGYGTLDLFYDWLRTTLDAGNRGASER
jgi:HAD superfamily hydrolase (TIGR01549 family)